MSAEEAARQALERQLYLSQQRVRDDIAQRTDSFCHFAISTGKVSQNRSQFESTAEMENSVHYVERKLIFGMNQPEQHISNQYNLPNQFNQGNDAEAENYPQMEAEKIDEPIPCDYW